MLGIGPHVVSEGRVEQVVHIKTTQVQIVIVQGKPGLAIAAQAVVKPVADDIEPVQAAPKTELVEITREPEFIRNFEFLRKDEPVPVGRQVKLEAVAQVGLNVFGAMEQVAVFGR